MWCNSNRTSAILKHPVLLSPSDSAAKRKQPDPRCRRRCRPWLKDRAEVKWAHAANTRYELLTALVSEDVDFIEADVRTVGHELVMQHLPNLVPSFLKDSAVALSFADFLTIVIDMNLTQPQHKRKGVKLDFKDTESAVRCFAILRERWDQIRQADVQIILNADVVPGPGYSSTLPKVSADQFIRGALLDLPGATISLGFAMGPSNGAYTDGMVQRMLDLCSCYRLESDVTFALSALHASKSGPQVEKLRRAAPSFSISLYGPTLRSTREWMRTLDPRAFFVDTAPCGPLLYPVLWPFFAAT